MESGSENELDELTMNWVNGNEPGRKLEWKRSISAQARAGGRAAL